MTPLRQANQLRKTPFLLETIKKLVHRGATTNLAKIFTKSRPSDIAQALQQLKEHERLTAFLVLESTDLEHAAETLSELPTPVGIELLSTMEPPRIARLLQELPTDDATHLAAHLPTELSEQVLELMQVEASVDVREQLEYAENTAGRIMTPEVFALREDVTVSEATAVIQKRSEEFETVLYLYVVDEHNHLVGVISLRQLLTNPPSTPLRKIMSPDVIRVRTDTDQEEVAQLVASYNLLAIPVVTDENKLVGLITVDDVIDVLREEATEDIYALAGLTIDERISTPAIDSVKRRLPWLYINLLTAILAASVVHLFENTIGKVVALATLMPIVAGMGGNAGTQTLTVIVRSLALGELTWENARWALFKETLVGLANGAANGAAIAIVAGLYFGNAMLGCVLGVAMIINMFVAAVAGTLIPLTLKRLRWDPAVSSGVFVTTCTDVFGFLSFLGLATLLIRYLE